MSLTVNDTTGYKVVVVTTSGRTFTEGPFRTIQKARKEAKRWLCGSWVKSAVVETENEAAVA